MESLDFDSVMTSPYSNDYSVFSVLPLFLCGEIKWRSKKENCQQIYGTVGCALA